MKILRDLSLAIRFLTIFPITSFPLSNNSNQDEEALTVTEDFANSMAFFSTCRDVNRGIVGSFKTDILLSSYFSAYR